MAEIKELQLDTLDSDKAVKKINELIAKAAKDIQARPRVKKDRVITLQVCITSDPDEDGNNFPKVIWKANHAFPGSKGSICSTYFKDNKLMTNVNDPHGEDPSQPTLFAQQVIDVAVGDED